MPMLAPMRRLFHGAVCSSYDGMMDDWLIKKRYQGKYHHLISATMPQYLLRGLRAAVKHIWIANFRAEF